MGHEHPHTCTHPHDHSHSDVGDHSHHTHVPDVFDRAFFVGIALNLAFVGVETVYGLLAHSLALIADAGHNLSDVLSLALAWGAIWLTRRRPSRHRTYGYGRSTILASLANAILLLIAAGAIGWEAIGRFLAPTSVESQTIIWVAVLGIAINAGTAMLFMRGKDKDINIRGAYLHMMADAAVSLGVVMAGVLIGVTGWQWIDPLMSLGIVAVIAFSTFGLFKESADMAIDAVPRWIDPENVRAYLLSCENVRALHDLHIWAISTTSIALTAHVIRPASSTQDEWLRQVAQDLHDKFGIDHPTIQIEHEDGSPLCKLAPESVI